MANKKLFPNAQALPPKAPKIKGSRWKKSAEAPSPTETPADEAATAIAEPTAAEPVVETMPSAEASKAAVGAQGQSKRKQTGKPKAAAAKPKKESLSMVEAAQKVLAEKGEAMSCRDMIDAMSKAGYWKSPGGLTPHNTLYSAILRLIQRDGRSAAFRKTERGMFKLSASAQA